MVAKSSLLLVGVGLGTVLGALPASAQSTCAELAGQAYRRSLALETEKLLGGAEVTTAFGGGAVLERPVCRVRGRIRPSSDSDIRFEVWLPEAAAWNGRTRASAAVGTPATTRCRP